MRGKRSAPMKMSKKLLTHRADGVRRSRAIFHCGLLALVSIFPNAPTLAKEYALIVGGGNSQWRNPASLERQVKQAIEILEKRILARIDVLFADGDDPTPDLLDETISVEELRPDEPSPRERSMLRLYGHDFPAPYVQLRNHENAKGTGAATKANIEAWFSTQGVQLQAGDRLILYFATHGVPASGEMSGASTKCQLLLWGGERLGVDELAALVNGLPPKVEVQLIVTACYGGGFAELGWPNQLSEKQEKKPHVITGFYATAADRPAAGCTSESESTEFRSYATCFWSALSDNWPDGEKVTQEIDLNSDGEISFSEAHAFAMVNDTTLDTPLKTSDYVLRQISRVGRLDESGVLRNDPYYAELHAAASKEDQQLLDQLSARLSLEGERRLSKARTELRLLESELRSLSEERDEVAAKVAQQRVELIQALNQRYPALAQLSDQPQAALSTVRKLLEKQVEEDDEPLLELKAKYNFTLTKLRKHDFDRLMKEALWARYQRFVQTAESVILAHNLPLVVEDKAVLQRFEALKNAENSPLVGTR